MHPPENKPDAPEKFTGRLVDAPRFYRQWMLLGNPALFIDQVIHDFGDFIHCRGLIDFYLINHPTLIRQVLRDTHRDFDKNSRIYNHFRNVFGNGLVTAEGEDWKQKRKLMQPMFAPHSIRPFFDLMTSAAGQQVADWSRKEAEVIEMADAMSRLTLEIAGRAFFSDAFDGYSGRIREWTEEINRYCAKPPLPLISDPRFPTPSNLRLRRVLGEFARFMQTLIRQRLEAPPRGDLLGLLLCQGAEENLPMPTEAEIGEEVLGLIVGGHETSATALVWIWWELASHPEVEERLLAELREVTQEGPIQFEHLPSLRYANQVIQEAMRLHPPFWFENRNARHALTLGETPIPAGAMVVFSRYSLQRHPGFWKDPERFDPDRFHPDNTENPGVGNAHIPFGSGPRICIGRHFAMMELLVIVATILQKFHIAVDSSDRHRMSAHLTMTPKHGLRVRLIARERAFATVL